MSTKNFIKGLGFGALVGGSLALLFAPSSGNELRKKLTDETDDATNLTNDLNSSLKNFQQAVSDVRQTAKEVVPVFAKETKKMVNDFTFQAEPRISEIQKQIKKFK